MKYRILKCRNAEISDYVKNFYNKVEKYLDQGWTLHGELQVVVTHNEFINYYQVVIKDDENIETDNNNNHIHFTKLNMKSGSNEYLNNFKKNSEYIKSLKEQTINSY